MNKCKNEICFCDGSCKGEKDEILEKQYSKLERVAIKMDSGIPEHLAIKQTEQELTPPECIQRLQSFKQKKLEIEAAKRAKHSKRFNYE